MKPNPLLSIVLTVLFFFLIPTLVQAHPGHSAFDPTAGAPHAGHAVEWASLALFVALTGGLLGIRWLENRRQ